MLSRHHHHKDILLKTIASLFRSMERLSGLFSNWHWNFIVFLLQNVICRFVVIFHFNVFILVRILFILVSLYFNCYVRVISWFWGLQFLSYMVFFKFVLALNRRFKKTSFCNIETQNIDKSLSIQLYLLSTFLIFYCCCLPCGHCSNWTLVVEEILAFVNRLRFKHRKEFPYLKYSIPYNKFFFLLVSVPVYRNSFEGGYITWCGG